MAKKSTKYDFPKIELHLHLDGAFRPKTIFELAQQQHKKLPANTVKGFENWMKVHSNSKDVNDYLQMFDAPLLVMQDKASIARVTKEVIEDLAKQGVTYAEIRFAPQLHTREGLTQRQAIEAVLEGRKQGLKECPNIKIGIICCMMCIGPETANWKENKETATIAHEYLKKGVVAVDLAGAEGIVPLSKFAPLFKIAKKYKTPIICHAGDSQDWHTVEDAIKFGVSRIGHGHHIYENPELCRLAAKHQIALEICPTSNIQCKTRSSYKMHPAWALFHMGIPVTISTDNSTMARVSIDDEYDHCVKEMGFTYDDLIVMNIYACMASFMPSKDKEKIFNELCSCYDKQVEKQFKKKKAAKK